MSDKKQTVELEELKGKTQKYEELLKGHSQISERSVPIHLMLGKLYERSGEKAAAIQEFAKVALYYADQSQMMKAMAAAQLIVRLDPENEEILDRLGELYFMRGAVSDEQLEDYQESISQIEALQNVKQESPQLFQEELDEDEIDVTSALKKIELFAKLSVSELRGLQSYSTLRSLIANEPLFTAGNVNRSIFVILQGSVKIFGKDKEQRNTHLATLEHGSLFGEFALFGKIDRRTSVIAEQNSKILEIPREIVLKIAKTRPQLTHTLKELFKHRILESALARVPLFSQMQPEARKEIVARFKALRAKQGTTIIREGETGDSMYFIVSGKVGVYTSLVQTDEDAVDELKEEQLQLATLKSGDFFGEQALVTEEVRSATVTTLSDSSLLKLSKHDLTLVIKEFPWIESALQIEAYQNRMRTNLSILNQIAPSD
jgi:CRP-like cAMP-binding protein